jgi:hypothetical protein
LVEKGDAMECFVHTGRAAVGVCKSCGKALCRECADELNEGLACRSDACRRRLNLYNWIMDHNVHIVRDYSKRTQTAGWMLMGSGGLVAVFSLTLFYQRVGGSPDVWILLLGAVALIISGFRLLRRKAPTSDNLENWETGMSETAGKSGKS